MVHTLAMNLAFPPWGDGSVSSVGCTVVEILTGTRIKVDERV